MAALIFSLWDAYITTPGTTDILSVVFKVVVLAIVGVIFAIPLVGTIVAVVIFVVFLIVGPSIAGDEFFLTGLVVVLIVCAAPYLYIIVRSKKWATRWWILVHIGCLTLPTIVLIVILWGEVAGILFLIFFASIVAALLIALKRLKKIIIS